MTTRQEAIEYGLSFPDSYLDGTVPEQEIKRMIAESYDLVKEKRS